MGVRLVSEAIGLAVSEILNYNYRRVYVLPQENQYRSLIHTMTQPSFGEYNVSDIAKHMTCARTNIVLLVTDSGIKFFVVDDHYNDNLSSEQAYELGIYLVKKFRPNKGAL